MLLKPEIFRMDSVEGSWSVENDDLLTSQSKYKNFFWTENDGKLDKTNS